MAQRRYFIIAGTEKAGTTSVFVYLAEHPEVCASVRKETDFFRRTDVDGPLSLDDYEQQFTHCADSNPIHMEASPAYLGEARTVAPRMASALPNAQLLFILRNPVERLHSSYHFHVGRLNINESVSFEAYVDKCFAYDGGEAGAAELGLDAWYLSVLRYGRYSEFLKIYLSSFPSANIRVMFFEDLRDDPQAFMHELSAFLGIDAAFWDTHEFHRENVTFSAGNKSLHRLALGFNRSAEPCLRRMPRLKSQLVALYKRLNQAGEGYAPMADDVRSRLQAYYAPSNGALSELLGRNIPSSWRTTA